MVALFLAALMLPGPPQAGAHQQPVRVVHAANSEPTAVGSEPTAVGIGHPPAHMRGAQARLMAKRAAEVRAVRNLATKVGHGRRTTIRGFRYLSTTYRTDGSVRVVVKYAKPRYSRSHSLQRVGRLRYGHLHHHRRTR